MIAPSALRALAQKATPGPWFSDATDAVEAVPHFEIDGIPWELGLTRPNAAFIAACDPQTILALLDAVEAATDLITNAADSSRDVELEARRRLIAALAPFTETQTRERSPTIEPSDVRAKDEA